jgi:hypothetical protein
MVASFIFEQTYNTTFMPVRKTESRIPTTFQPADLGEAFVMADNRAALIAYSSSPIATQRLNTYVVMVTNPALATQVQRFTWTFRLNATETTQTTDFGVVEYIPNATGTLVITVALVGTPVTLALTQQVTALNPALETLITEAGNRVGPTIANPEVARELVNQYCRYYGGGLTLTPPEAGDGFQKIVFNYTYKGAETRTPAQRKQHLDRLAETLNNHTGNFGTEALDGAGVCEIKLPLLAMIVPENPIAWTELPVNATRQAAVRLEIMTRFNALSENVKIELYNLVRFPKSNVKMCGKVLETLRNRYHSGVNFNDVLTRGGGVISTALDVQFRNGPIARE